jgi:hypothetical protein
MFESMKIAMSIDFLYFMVGGVNFEPTIIDTKSITSFFPTLELAFNNLNLDCISHDGLGNYKHKSHHLYSVMLEDFYYVSYKPIENILKMPVLTEYELNQLLIHIKFAKLKLFHFEMFYSKNGSGEFLPSYFYELHFQLDKLQEQVLDKLISLKK